MFGRGKARQQCVRSDEDHALVRGPPEGNVSKEVASIEVKIAGHVGDQDKKPPSTEKIPDGDRGQIESEGAQENMAEEQEATGDMKTHDKDCGVEKGKDEWSGTGRAVWPPTSDHDDGPSHNKGQKVRTSCTTYYFL